MLKKILTFFFSLILLVISINKTYATPYGNGDVILSTKVISALYNYLNNKKGNPDWFALHVSGKYYSYWYCPREFTHGCEKTMRFKIIKSCEEWANENNVSGKCYFFARKNYIKWKNSLNKKTIKIPKNLSKKELENFLLQNKFVSENVNIPIFDTDNPDLIEKLKGLQKLLDQGALTQKDFDKAKKKLLNKQ